MNTIELKRELHEYIEEADDRLLNLVYGLFLVDKQTRLIPEWHKEILNDRLKELEQNPDNVISWEKVNSAIEKMK